ncbi:MAG: hypothetical protein ACJ8M1_13750 [Chthoniobacterales bacterium]
MNRTKHRRALFLATIFAALSVWVLIILTKPTAPQPVRGSASIDPRVHWPPLPPLPEFTKYHSPAGSPEVSVTDSAIGEALSQPDPLPDSQHLSRGADMLSVKLSSPVPVRLISLGVVDVALVLTIHPPKTNSTEARLLAIDEIRRAVAFRAEAHDLLLIFDSSGETRNGVRAVLSAAPPYDLTQEVIQQLGHSPVSQHVPSGHDAGASRN